MIQIRIIYKSAGRPCRRDVASAPRRPPTWQVRSVRWANPGQGAAPGRRQLGQQLRQRVAGAEILHSVPVPSGESTSLLLFSRYSSR